MKGYGFAKTMVAAVSNLLRPFPHFHHHIKQRYYLVLENRWERARLNLMSFLANTVEQEPRPYFVKVGANDGVTGDPIGDALIKDRRWHGLLIEPVSSLFEKLRQNYSDPSRFTLLPIAVGGGPSVASFYYVDEVAKRDLPNLPSWYDQLGSFSRQHILNHLDGILEPYIREQLVRVERLSTILRTHEIDAVALLHIDTEGADLCVLETLDLSKLRPRAILIEHKHLTSGDKYRLRKILDHNGYRIHDCGSDFFACSR